MTAQMGDIVRDKEQTFTILRVSGGDLFDPEDWGFCPVSFSTACWRGYRCTYEVKASVLRLQELLIQDGRGFYPPVNGVSIPGRDSASWLAYDPETLEPNERPIPLGPETYRDIGMPVPFTGKLLLADEFDIRYYVHMGLQAPHGYGKLFTYLFENGALKSIEDHCETARLLRELAERDADPDPAFLRRSRRAPYELLPEELLKTVWWRI